LTRSAGSNASRTARIAESDSASNTGHVPQLVQPDAVLAGDGAAGRDARVHDLRGGGLDAGLQPVVPGVEGDVGVEVAVARVEDVAHHEPRARGDLRDRFEDVGEGGAGDHGVLDHEIAGQASHRAERLLAALPQPLALADVGGRAHRARAVRAQQVLDRPPLGLHRGLRHAVELDQQHGRGVSRITRGVHRVLDRPDAAAVHHLERGRDDPAGDHGGHRRPGRP
jgi:hypothetical protein